MKAIRLLKPIILDGSTERVQRGQAIQVPQQITEQRAKKLVAKGMAIPVAQEKDIDKKKKGGPVPPISVPQDGIPTGEDQQSSVSDQDHQPKRRRKSSTKSSTSTKRSKKSKS